MTSLDRLQILNSLIAFEDPDEPYVRHLAAFPWDIAEPLVALQASHIVSILDRFLRGQLSAQQVEHWANLLESREDIEYVSAKESPIAAAIHTLANPVLEGELTFALAEKLKVELKC